MNQAQALYRLQTLESSIDQAKNRVDAIEAALGDNKAIQTSREAVAVVEAELHQSEARVKELEQEIAQIDSKLGEGEQQLYDGSIHNPKLLQEKQDEIESLKRRRTKVEGELSAAINELEGFRNRYQNADDGLQSLLTDQAEQAESMAKEREKLHHQMRDWLAERKDVLQMVNKEHYKLYKHLKPMKNGVAVARLEGDTCSACRVAQNQTIIYQIRQMNELVQCGSCGRLLIEV